METKDRHPLLSIYDADDFIKDANGCSCAERIIIQTATQKISAILKKCKDKKLAFTDDENGNDLTANVQYEEESETLLVDEVKLINDRIAVVLENGENWHPWEVGIDFITLLMAMADELKREFNL